MTLAMLAHAFLAAVSAAERARTTGETGLIPLTLAEVQRLFNRLTTHPARSSADDLHWSHWRRRHQARARQSHYQRQSTEQT